MFGILNGIRTLRRREGGATELPLESARYVVFDTELTGLNEKRDSIVSIGAIRMTGGRINLGESFYRLIHPETEIRAEGVKIHGITPSDVVGEPDIESVLNEFVGFLGNDILVGHCAFIDLAFINREMKRCFGRMLGNPLLDTVSLYAFTSRLTTARGAFASAPRDYSRLYDIAKSLGISVAKGHNSLMDAFMTAQVFQRLIPHLTGAGYRSAGEVMKMISQGGDAFRMGCEIINL